MLYDISNRNYNSSHNPRTPQFWKRLHKFGKTSQPPKKGLFDPKKSENLAQKKSLFPNPLGHVHFAKNQVKFGIFWPLEPHLQSTAAYRGSPPCAIFHHPDKKEILHSNVLGAT